MNETKITSDNLYLILPFKVSQLAKLYAKQFSVTVKDALKTIYNSNTYRELEKEETKLWQLGPVALLEHLQEFD